MVKHDTLQTEGMKKYRNSLILFIAVLVVTESTFIYFIDLGRPLYGDEAHFLDAIHLFGKGLTLHTLKHYPEMITPLSVILYSLWGRLFGFELVILRSLSVLIAVATYLMMHRLLFVVFRDSKIAVLTTLFIMLNPYMIGLNCFVYTDMIGILCIVAACLAIYHDNAFLFAVSAAATVLCRRSFYRNLRTLVICFFISSWYWLFPVRPGKVLTDAGIQTVGFFSPGPSPYVQQYAL